MLKVVSKEKIVVVPVNNGFLVQVISTKEQFVFDDMDDFTLWLADFYLEKIDDMPEDFS